MQTWGEFPRVSASLGGIPPGKKVSPHLGMEIKHCSIQVCIVHDRRVYRYRKGICPHGQCVAMQCVRVGHSSRAQCTKNMHPLVLSVFFYVCFVKTADRMLNPE